MQNNNGAQFGARRRKMQFWKKVIFCLMCVVFSFVMKRGQQQFSHLNSQITINEKKLKHIFQTTIAVQTKTFTTKLYKDAQGLMSLIPYLNEAKWAEVRIELSTRIGVDLSKTPLDISYDPETNNVHLDFGDPYVLDRTWKSQILSSSQGFFSKWDLKQYQMKKNQFVEQFIQKQSNNILTFFRNNLQKKYDLQNNYQRQILGLINHKDLSMKSMINKFNTQLLRLCHINIPKKLIPLKLSNYSEEEYRKQSNYSGRSYRNKEESSQENDRSDSKQGEKNNKDHFPKKNKRNNLDYQKMRRKFDL